ncbi:MAG TPA: YidB family protein [Acidobacteriaceae bacterium]|jgi:uncharacterized protein YidB (DUF937 family)
MGLLDNLENMASQAMEQSGNPSAKVAGGLMQALEQHPGGLQGVMDHMSGNGVDPQALASGQTSTTEQIGQGLKGSGLIESVAEKAGVSPETAQQMMATVLPLVMSHFTQGGTAAPPASGFGGMAESIVSKFL